jgi:hypothetical protein
MKEHRSYDFVHLYVESWSYADEQRKHAIQKKYGIFVAPRITAGDADEYPQI